MKKLDTQLSKLYTALLLDVVTKLESKELSLAINDNKDIVKFTNGFYLATLTVDAKTVLTDEALKELIRFLSDEQRTNVLFWQQDFLNNDDYLFYDLKLSMFSYIQRHCTKEYFTFFEAKIAERFKAFKESNAYNEISKQYEVICKQMSEMQANSKARDLLIDEKAWVENNFAKLEEFVKAKKHRLLSVEQQSLLLQQHAIMKSYIEVLQARLNVLNAESKC